MWQSKKNRIRTIIVTSIALIVYVLLSSLMADCVKAQPNDSDDVHHPALFLGNESLPPMCYMEHGKPTGIVIDLANAIARHMRRPVEIQLMNWTEAQQLVKEGRADALLQINTDPERQKIYDFSDPLLTTEFTIFTSTERFGISSMRDLHELKVGVEKSGLPIFLLQEHPQIIVIIIPDFVQGFKRLTTGAVDAVVADRWVGSFVLAENKFRGVKFIEEPISRSSSAIAVKKGNKNLLADINSALAEIRQDGTYDKIIKPWQVKEIVFKTREQLRQQAWMMAGISAVLIVTLIGVAVLVMEIRRRKKAEEELLASRRQLTDIIEFLPEATLAINKEKRVIIWNKAIEKMTGIPAAEMIDRGDYAYTIPFYGKARPQLMDLIFMNHVDIVAQYPNIRRESDSITVEVFCNALYNNKGAWIVAKASPLHDQYGKIVGAIESIRDITDRKQIEAEKEKVEAQNRMLQKTESLGRMAGATAHHFNN